jgi:hypothetical protein
MFFYYLRVVKYKDMKRRETKNIGFAGCKKNPVAIFAPIRFAIDIVFL